MKYFEHNKTGTTPIYTEIHVTVYNTKTFDSEVHVFRDTRSYRHYIIDNMTFARLNERTWVTSGTGVILRETYYIDETDK
jgi:hypothetical protein